MPQPRTVLAAAVTATLGAALALPAARAQTAQPSGQPSPIKVEGPWLRATPKGAPVVGGYAVITNTGREPDRLVGASIPVAARAEVHTMSMANGVMHMEKLGDGLALAPGATVKLAPGGYHLMFFSPSEPIKEGQSITGSLTFAKAGTVPVTFAVGAVGATVAPGAAAPAAGVMSGEGMHSGMKDMR